MKKCEIFSDFEKNEKKSGKIDRISVKISTKNFGQNFGQHFQNRDFFEHFRNIFKIWKIFHIFSLFEMDFLWIFKIFDVL